jgi:IS30 family transposase
MSGEQERAERAERAQKLREENPDLSVRAIAEKLGVSVGTAHRDLEPDAKRRANEASKKAQRQMRPRMESAEKRLDQIETTVVDLSDRLAALEAHAGHRPKGRGKEAARALEALRQRSPQPSGKPRATPNQAAGG